MNKDIFADILKTKEIQIEYLILRNNETTKKLIESENELKLVKEQNKLLIKEIIKLKGEKK